MGCEVNSVQRTTPAHDAIFGNVTAAAAKLSHIQHYGGNFIMNLAREQVTGSPVALRWSACGDRYPLQRNRFLNMNEKHKTELGMRMDC